MTRDLNRKVVYIYVPMHRKGWAVKKQGAQRALRLFDSQIKAVAYAVDFRHKGFDVYVHDIQGRVQEWFKATKAA